MRYQVLKKTFIKPLKVKTWLKYRKLGLGQRVVVKSHFYSDSLDIYKGARGQRGRVIALYFDSSLKTPDAYGIALDKPFLNGTDLSVIPVFEKTIVRLTSCELGHGLWAAGDNLEFL